MADIKITADVSSIRDAEKALKRFSEASEKLGRSVLQVADKTRAVSSGWQQANKYYKEGTINAKALKAAQVELARELATLNGYTKSNGALNTQRALAELKATESARRNAEETKKAAEALRQSSEQYQRLKATSDPAWASQQKLAQAVKTVREQVRQKNISVKEGMTTLRAYKAQLDAAVVSGQGFGRSMNRSGVMVQQAGYQVGDFIVQVQSGTNAFVAFGQQATQVAGTLTLLGGKWLMIGSALGIAIPLLTAVGAAIMRTREEADDTSDEIKRLADQFENALSKSKDLADSIRELKLGVSPEELAILDKITESQEALVAAQEAAEKSRERLRRPGKAALKAVELAEQELAANKEALKVLRERMKEEGALRRARGLEAEGAELRSRARLIQEEAIAGSDLNSILSARVREYNLLNQKKVRSGEITAIEGAMMRKSFAETERLRLEYDMLIKPAVKFAEAVEAAGGDARELAGIDINYAILQAAISAGVLSEEMEKALKAGIDMVEEAPEVAAAGARMAANYQGRSGLPKEFGGTGSNTYLLDGNDRDKDKKKKQPDRIGALAKSLATEAEMLESWRSEGLLQIQDFNAKELELLGGHQAAVERLEQEHQNRLNAIRTTEQVATLNGYADLFGALGSLMGTKGKKLLQIQAGLSGAATMISSYEAAANAAAKAPDPISAAAAWAGWVAKGVSTVAKIKSIGQSGNASAGGSGGSGSIATPSAATEAAPQRVLVEGIGPNDLISGAQLSEIFDRLYEENENRGLVFQIAT